MSSNRIYKKINGDFSVTGEKRRYNKVFQLEILVGSTEEIEARKVTYTSPSPDCYPYLKRKDTREDIFSDQNKFIGEVLKGEDSKSAKREENRESLSNVLGRK